MYLWEFGVAIVNLLIRKVLNLMSKQIKTKKFLDWWLKITFKKIDFFQDYSTRALANCWALEIKWATESQKLIGLSAFKIFLKLAWNLKPAESNDRKIQKFSMIEPNLISFLESVKKVERVDIR